MFTLFIKAIDGKVEKTGNKRTTSTNDNKDDAVRRSHQEAKKENSELIINRK
jgi:hypothetical protein